MTTQQFHDALTYLPDDLLEETQHRRSHPQRVILFRRYAAMAACFALVLFASLFLTHLTQPKGATEMAIYEAAEAPAAAMTEIGQEAAAECAPAEPAMEESPTADSAVGSSENANSTMRYTSMILHTDGKLVIISDADTKRLREMLFQLSYDPQSVCNCIAEYVLEMENEKIWEVNLTEGFVRTTEGQALLTAEEKTFLQDILHAAVK